MTFDLSRYAPPGWDLRREKQIFGYGMILAAFAGLVVFLARFCDALDRLYWTQRVDGEWERTLRPGAVMADYKEVLGGALLGFGILALCLAAFIPLHYAYHHQGSKSIYLMRRLPDRWERHRRCWTLPLLGIAACLLAAFLLLAACYAIYMLATPEECLTVGQWQKIWR